MRTTARCCRASSTPPTGRWSTGWSRSPAPCTTPATASARCAPGHSPWPPPTAPAPAPRLTLDFIGRAGWGGSIRLEGNVPLCWGCGSSTTDVLAVIRAVAGAFGQALEPRHVARLAVAAEPRRDSLMFPPGRAVLFAQRRGSLLVDLGGPLPRVQVLGVNTEPGEHGVATLSLAPCRYSAWEVEAFQPMLGLLRRAVEQQDPALPGRVASASTEINQRHRPRRHMAELLRLARGCGALGVQVAHSGSVAGLLFEPAGAPERIDHARHGLRRIGLGPGREFSSQLPQPEGVV